MEQHEIDHRSMSLGTLTLVQKSSGVFLRTPPVCDCPGPSTLPEGYGRTVPGPKKAAEGSDADRAKQETCFCAEFSRSNSLTSYYCAPETTWHTEQGTKR